MNAAWHNQQHTLRYQVGAQVSAIRDAMGSRGGEGIDGQVLLLYYMVAPLVRDDPDFAEAWSAIDRPADHEDVPLAVRLEEFGLLWAILYDRHIIIDRPVAFDQEAEELLSQ